MQPPRPDRPEFQRHILEHLVTLYEAWSKKDATKSSTPTEWKQKLEAFDKAGAEEKLSTMPKEKAK